MTTYRTPDVYVEEISVFPPSVAEVETAVPAFIGYTNKAKRLQDNDLKDVPTKVTSLLEYESLFGAGPKLDISEIELDDAGNFSRATLAATNTKYLYDSLRLFFNNGGGKCYIVSVGLDTVQTTKSDLIRGLTQIAKQDEPTILLFPDAAGMASADDLAAVQQEALSQCGKLGDRVALLDTRYFSTKNQHDQEKESFRNKIGINSLKYGAAYSPWLKLNYSKSVKYDDIVNEKTKLLKGGTAVTLSGLTADSGLQALIANLDNVLVDIKGMSARLAVATGDTDKTVSGKQGDLVLAYRSLNGKTVSNMEAMFGYLYQLASVVDDMLKTGTALKTSDLGRDVGLSIQNVLRPAYTDLIALEKELDSKLGGLNPQVAYTTQWDIDPDPSATQWRTDPTDSATNIFLAGATASTTGIPVSANTEEKILDAALIGLNRAFNIISSTIDGIKSGATGYRANYEKKLLDNFSAYRSIVGGVGNTLTTCPPSGAIAGIYALMDSTRGVWKAPANVSLAGVIEPAYYFDSDDTDNLNIDPVAGKSINAIRAFSGKGTLVWGARTLAGNDNEWRYVPVRRFFNMVEESVKKSTYWAVFEPNDANTWVKVRGMIENYLTQKWREGALAGSTTKEAFFVRCGLGVTMSAQDILNGYMNVEIGMAAVRPAEFIVLKFSHKLQTS